VAFSNAFAGAFSFTDAPNDKDLYEMASRTISQITEPSVKAAAQAVTNTFASAVLWEGHSSAYTRAHGLTIYYVSKPAEKDSDYTYYRANIEFALQTSWDEYLDANAATLPTVPTALAAAPGCGSIGLNWTAASGAAGYKVKRSTTSGSGYVPIGTAGGVSFTDTTMCLGTNYYVVVATNAAGDSANCAQVAAAAWVPPSVGAVSPPIQTVSPGASVTFTVPAPGGTGPFHYQWRRNSTTPVGTDSPSYTINPVAGPDAGTYDCVVSGRCTPGATAAGGTLVVNSPPVVVLASPTNGQYFLAIANIPLAASVAANGHTINQVNYYAGASQVGTSSTGPSYSATWSGVGSGSYSLTAVAVYDTSLMATSTPPASIVVLGTPTLSGYGPLSGTSFPLTFSGPSGQSYHVLSSTNMALPLASWTTLTSGTFGASPVTYTDTSATNGTKFYRIQSP
jgi:hypothetical protein